MTAMLWPSNKPWAARLQVLQLCRVTGVLVAAWSLIAWCSFRIDLSWLGYRRELVVIVAIAVAVVAAHCVMDCSIPIES